MSRNIFNLKTILSLSLVIIMMLSFASCSTNKGDTAFLDQISEAEAYSEDEMSTEESSEPPTQDGYTARPIVKHVINTSPYTVIVAGTCEEGSSIKAYNVANEDEVYETKALGDYFIMEITLSTTNEHYYEITASVEGKNESTVNHFSAQYNAVAETPSDGTAVTLGNNSTLFFEKLISAYKGESLLSNTELKSLKDKIDSNTSKSAIKYVYVMLPGVLSVYDEKIPESIKKDSYNTKFDQFIKAASQAQNADVLDLRETFIANKNGDYPLYYNTSGNLSDYGAYIAYQAIMDYVATSNGQTFDKTALPCKFNSVDGKGGNLITSLGLDSEIFTEKYFYAEKDFTTTIPEDATVTCPASDIVVYSDKDTNTYYTALDEEEVFGACENLTFKTNRPELPSAVFIRDNSMNSMVSMLAENFDNSYFEVTGNYSMTNSEITAAVSEYASENETYVDYVFVVVSEDNIDSLIAG